jgi:glucokinase
MRVLSLDMGGTHIGCAVVEDDKLLATGDISFSGAQSLRALLPVIEQELRRLTQSVGMLPSDTAGLAIGYPGIIDFRTSTILSDIGKYADGPGIDIGAWSQKTLGIPMAIENDARMALLGEHYVGAAVGQDDVVMLTLGTGIGGTVMMGGRLVRGAHAHAGSVGGHFVVDLNGRNCICGGIGCAEAEASGSTLPDIARKWKGFAGSSLNNRDPTNFKALFEEAAKGDQVAVEIRERCLHVWAANVVTQALAYDPEIVVIGGGVMRSSDVIIPFIQNYIDNHSWLVWGKPRILPAKLGNNAAFLGGVPLMIEAAQLRAAKG